MAASIPEAVDEIAASAGDLTDAFDEVDMSWAAQQPPTYQGLAYPGTEPGGLMESLAIGTGFDIAMVQQGLLPPATDFDTEAPTTDQTALCPMETSTSADFIHPALNDADAGNATYPADLDPLPTHHHHY